MIHEIQLTGYTASVLSSSDKLKLGTRDSYGNEQLRLNLDSEWKDLILTATFYAPGVGKGTRVLADADGLIVVPPEATAAASTIYPGRIVFAGIADGVQRISRTLLYDVADHIKIEGEESSITPSVLAQVITQTGIARNEALSAATEATQSATEAAASAEVAKKSKAAAEATTEHTKKIAESVEYTARAVETAKTEALNAVAVAKTEVITDIVTVKEESIKIISNVQVDGVTAVENAQNTAETSIFKKQECALNAIKTTQSELEQVLENIQSKTIQSVTAEGDIQAQRLKSIVSDIYASYPMASGNPAICDYSIAGNIQGLKVYGKSMQEGIPSPENPKPILSAGESGSIALYFRGKNLLNLKELSGQTFTSADGSMTAFINDDGTILVKGNTTKYTSLCLNNIQINLKSSVYVFGCESTHNNIGIQSVDSDWQSGLITTTERILTIAKDISKRTNIYIVSNGATPNFEILLKPYISFTSGSFVPYAGSQALILSTPNSLPGIPVTGNGNYIAADKKSYISNIWDFRTGLETVAVSKIVSYNGEKITTPYISSTGALTTGAQVFYALPKAYTQPIPADVMAVYHTLTTYNETTIVSTAEPVAGIEVTYLMNENKYRNALESRVTTLEHKLSLILNTITAQI